MTLTNLETKILAVIAEGFSSSEVAWRLSTSPAQVDHAITSSKVKLGAVNRVHCVVLALAHGWIDMPANMHLRPRSDRWDRITLITSRERQILELVAVGLSSGQIASACGCSVRTVDTHMDHVMAVTGALNRLHAVVVALARGQIQFATLDLLKASERTELPLLHEPRVK